MSTIYSLLLSVLPMGQGRDQAQSQVSTTAQVDKLFETWNKTMIGNGLGGGG